MSSGKTGSGLCFAAHESLNVAGSSSSGAGVGAGVSVAVVVVVIIVIAVVLLRRKRHQVANLGDSVSFEAEFSSVEGMFVDR